jgi:hypothetical protein
MSVESQKQPSQTAQEQNFQCSHWIRSTYLRVTMAPSKIKKKEKENERTHELININNANLWEINMLLVSSITTNTIY